MVLHDGRATLLCHLPCQRLSHTKQYNTSVPASHQHPRVCTYRLALGGLEQNMRQVTRKASNVSAHHAAAVLGSSMSTCVTRETCSRTLCAGRMPWMKTHATWSRLRAGMCSGKLSHSWKSITLLSPGRISQHVARIFRPGRSSRPSAKNWQHLTRVFFLSFPSLPTFFLLWCCAISCLFALNCQTYPAKNVVAHSCS